MIQSAWRITSRGSSRHNRAVTARDLARLRLHNQRITTQAHTPGEAVRRLGAVQAQDYLASLWAVGLRVAGATERTVQQAIAERNIVRTWPLRGTIHWVAAEDVWWMLNHFAQRVIATRAARYRELELDAETFAKSGKVLEQSLQGGRSLRREAVYAELAAVGISSKNGRGMHILGYHAHAGLICFGPYALKQPTFVLLEEWVPRPAIPSREEALAELTRRYFVGHGPATLKDFAWWSGLGLAEARKGLEAVRGELEETAFNGQTYYFKPATPAESEFDTHLLPAFDEFVVAYANRDAVLEAAFSRRYHDGGGVLRPVVVVDGQVVGVWRRVLTAKAAKIALEAFHSLSKTQLDSVALAAQRYGAFLGRPAELT